LCRRRNPLKRLSIFTLYHDEKGNPDARQETRHAARDRGSRRNPRQLRDVPQVSAARAVLLRGESQRRTGHREDALQGGASFDVASLPEFMLVYENIKKLSAKAQQDFIWDKIIYANPTKPKETLLALDKYKPLVTYDNVTELHKIKKFAPHAGVVLRLAVANTGSQCELSNKFGCEPGEAVDLILAAFQLGLVVEGLSFPCR
jgi:hypothetical protein